MPSVVAFAAGLVFALGLGVGGMTEPGNVLAFLDVAGAWDPSLGLVMFAAIAVHAPVVRWVLAGARAPAARTPIDARLVLGAATFGVGWGLAGLCPGPAITALASGEPKAVLFVVAMLVGMAGFALAERAAVAIAGRARRATSLVAVPQIDA